MAENTKIQWTRHTFNPWIGCAAVAEGCLNCYAEFMMDDRYHRVEWGPNGTRSRTKTWNQPLKWNREAGVEGEPRKVFCASLADVFEDFKGDSLSSWRAELFDLIDATPMLHWLLLTKRPQNIRRMWPENPWPGALRENVWLGTSIANQKNAEQYIPELLECRHLCKYLFLSIEPQIDMVDLSRWLDCVEPLVDWVIVGGESRQGKEARPFKIAWARHLVNQCREAGVPCFVKQFGSNVWDKGRRVELKDSHGGDMAEWDPELRVRECPESYYPELAYSY